MSSEQLELTARQREILRRVVEDYVETGQPVGSKALVERAGMTVSASTVRNELADLESLGLLTHPHTSAGRVPTERGYRYYAQVLLGGPEPAAARGSLPRRASASVHRTAGGRGGAPVHRRRGRTPRGRERGRSRRLPAFARAARETCGAAGGRETDARSAPALRPR